MTEGREDEALEEASVFVAGASGERATFHLPGGQPFLRVRSECQGLGLCLGSAGAFAFGWGCPGAGGDEFAFLDEPGFGVEAGVEGVGSVVSYGGGLSGPREALCAVGVVVGRLPATSACALGAGELSDASESASASGHECLLDCDYRAIRDST